MRDSYLAYGQDSSHHGDDCGSSEGHADQGAHECGTSVEYGAHGDRGDQGDQGDHDHESAHAALMAPTDDAEPDKALAPQESGLAADTTAGGPGTVTKPLSTREVTSEQLHRIPDFGPLDCCSGG